MAGRKEIMCVGPSYQLTDRKAAVQRAVNLRMRQISGLGESNQVVLESVEGLSTFVTMPAEIRGVYASDQDRWFIVAGNTLYELDAVGTQTARGTLATSTGFVSMKNGLFQLVIVDGPNGYVFTFATNALAQITDPDWRGSQWVEELNGSFIFVPADEPDQFYLSAIDDGSDFDALDFSSSDAQPDNIVTHRVTKQELVLFNARSTEIWIYTGAADFPLVRYNSTPIDVGCVGLRAASNTSDSLFWIGRTKFGQGIVYEMRGHQPMRVSTDAVEQSLKKSTDMTQATMWAYQVEGAELLGVNAPGLATTWVYNLATQQWHEQARLVAGDWSPWPADQLSFFGAQHYAAAGTNLYRVSDTEYTIGGEVLARERTWPHLMAGNMEPIAYRGLQLACTTGYGGNITLEISNDGGYVWLSPLLRSLGAIGRRMESIRWGGLGAAVDRVFRLRCTDPVPLTIHSAAVDA